MPKRVDVARRFDYNALINCPRGLIGHRLAALSAGFVKLSAGEIWNGAALFQAMRVGFAKFNAEYE